MPIIADRSKPYKQKDDVGQSSLHDVETAGYGKSPVVTKTNLPAVRRFVKAHDFSTSTRSNSKRRTNTIQHPNSAPARDRRMDSLPSGISPVPDLFNEDEPSKPPTSKKRKVPSKKSVVLIPESSSDILNASMPSGMELTPNLGMDSSEDEGSPIAKTRAPTTSDASRSDSRPVEASSRGFDTAERNMSHGSFQEISGTSLASLNSSTVLKSIPGKGKKKIIKKSMRASLNGSPGPSPESKRSSLNGSSISPKSPTGRAGSASALLDGAPQLPPSPVTKRSQSLNAMPPPLSPKQTKRSISTGSASPSSGKNKGSVRQTMRYLDTKDFAPASTVTVPALLRKQSRASSVESAPPSPTKNKYPTRQASRASERGESSVSTPSMQSKRAVSAGSVPPSPGKNKALAHSRVSENNYVSAPVGLKKNVPRNSSSMDGASPSPGKYKAVVNQRSDYSSSGLKSRVGSKSFALNDGLVPTLSPGKTQMTVKPAGSRSATPQAQSKKPGGQDRTRTNQMMSGRKDSILSLDADRPASPRRSKKKMPEVPRTWHDNRASRKLNSSNLRQKIGGLAMAPMLDEVFPKASQRNSKAGSTMPGGSQRGRGTSILGSNQRDNSTGATIPKSSQRGNSAGAAVTPTFSHQRGGNNNTVRKSSHHRNQSLDASRRSMPKTSSQLLKKRSSSQPPRLSNTLALSQSSHVQRGIPGKSNHATDKKQLSQSAHAGRSIPRDSIRPAVAEKIPSKQSMHKAGGMVGTIVGLMDSVLMHTVSVPSSKYGTDGKDDDPDTDSFANDDIEAADRKKAKSSFKKDKNKRTPTLKPQEEKKKSAEDTFQTSQALKFMENTLGIEKKPPKTLVLVWILIVAELTFDFVTTVISFQVFSEGSECCSHEMNLGRLPVGITAPFFFLVLAESCFLFIAICLSLWPSILADNDDPANQSCVVRSAKRLLCCIRWDAKIALYALNVTVLLNPFFGCVIAWILLYQSDKFESFLVLGLEGGSIVLHFASVWLEGSCKSKKEFCFHCIQLIPFLTSVTLILFYLRQGGVCYLVAQEKFLFTGCELCPDGSLPNAGICQLQDGTNISITGQRAWEVEGGFGDLADALTARTSQGKYCADQHPGGPPDVNFCFFTY